MKKLIGMIVLASFGAVAAEEGLTSADYVRDGLVAHWDGKDYCGVGIPTFTRTTGQYADRPWFDLAGGRKIGVRHMRYWPETGPAGSVIGTMRGELADMLAPSETGVTLEIAVTPTDACEKYGYQTFFIGPKSSGIAIERCQKYLGMDSYPNSLLLANDGFPDQPQKHFSPTPTNQLAVISVGYTNGCIVADHVFCNGERLSAVAKTFMARESVPADETMSINCSGGYHSIRIYNRLLTAAEVAANAKIDENRYAKEYCFTVLSGSVTLGDTAYGAGEKVYVEKGATASVAATGAVLEPRADGQSKIAVTSGTVTIRRADSLALCYVKALALGADVTLNVPAPGLDAGALTADASATATGAGLLVAAAATSPVAGSVAYRSATAAWTGWPTTETTAYVPAGALPTIASAADVAAVAALDEIVFMDDGTAAAEATAIRYTDATPLPLKASLVGPGSFAAISAGKITISGDSRHFAGNFALTNTEALVTHEYGLGSSESRSAQLAIGSAGLVNFDDGTDVFTNRAPIYMTRATSSDTAKFGSLSLDHQLVQAELFYAYGSTVQFVNNAILEKGYQFNHSDYYPKNVTKGGVTEIRGDLGFDSSTSAYAPTGKGVILHSENTVSKGTFYASSGGVFVQFGKVNAWDPYFGYSTRDSSNVMDLNGYDQAIPFLSRLSSELTSAAKHLTVTSGVPATLTITEGAAGREMKILFRGAVSLKIASPATVTNLYSSVVSDTTGSLTVESGGLILENGYRWLGEDISVKAGKLILRDDDVFSKKATLSIAAAEGGVVTLPDGGDMKMHALVCDGRRKGGGVYGGAAALAAGKIDARRCLKCFDAASTGVLRVPGGLCLLIR